MHAVLVERGSLSYQQGSEYFSSSNVRTALIQNRRISHLRARAAKGFVERCLRRIAASVLSRDETGLPSMSDQAQAMVVGALYLPHQGEVGSGHGYGL